MLGRVSPSPDAADRLLVTVRRAESRGFLLLVCPAKEQKSWLGPCQASLEAQLILPDPQLLHELPNSDPSWLISQTGAASQSRVWACDFIWVTEGFLAA